MPRLGRSQYQQILDVIDAAHASANLVSMFEGLCERLGTILTISCAVWLPCDRDRDDYQMDHQQSFPPSLLTGFLWCSALEWKHFLERYPLEQIKPTRSSPATEVGARPTFTSSRLKVFVHSPVELSETLHWQGMPMARLFLHRSQKCGAFTKLERLLCQALLPHVASAAHSISMRTSLLESEHATPKTSQHTPVGAPADVLFRLETQSFRLYPVDSISSLGKVFLLDSMFEPQMENLTAYGLSKRQRQIAFLVIKGCSNREIASQLCIAEQTVKDQLHHIFGKMNIQHRSELAAIAFGLRTT